MKLLLKIALIFGFMMGLITLFADDLTDYTDSGSFDSIESTSEAVRQIHGEHVEALEGKMTATFQGSTVSDVFKQFAIVTGLNIMVSPSIEATVTASFSDASIKDAFLAILSANDLYYLEQGNIIKIMTQEEYLTELARNYLETRTYDASIIDLDNLSSVVKPLLTPGVGSMTMDAQSSKIIITDVEESFERLEDLFEQIGTPPLMVEIETRIIQIELQDNNDMGVDWQALNIGDAVDLDFDFVADSGVGEQDFSIAATHTFPDTPITVDALISALANDKELTLLAQPSVICINRETAWIHIGEKVPYISSQLESATTGSTTSTVEFTDVGIKLTVTPVVSPDGEVMMEIEANSSTYQMEAITSTENAPRIITTELECDAVVNSGETIIIGGLIQTEKSFEIKGLPFLSRVPILKYFFSRTTEVDTRKELVIFLTPRIIERGESNVDLDHISENMMESYQSSIYDSEDSEVEMSEDDSIVVEVGVESDSAGSEDE